MCYSPINEEKYEMMSESVKKLDWTMYLPQIVMLALAFVLGVYMPIYISNLISYTVG